MYEVVLDHIATGVTRVVWTASVLQCGKRVEKLPHYYLSWIVVFPETETNARCFLWKRNNREVNYSPIRIPGGWGGGYFKRKYHAERAKARRTTKLQTEAEGTAQLQDCIFERKELGTSRKIEELEDRGAEERSVCCRRHWSVVERTRWNKKWWLYDVLFRGWKYCMKGVNSGA